MQEFSFYLSGLQNEETLRPTLKNRHRPNLMMYKVTILSECTFMVKYLIYFMNELNNILHNSSHKKYHAYMRTGIPLYLRPS